METKLYPANETPERVVEETAETQDKIPPATQSMQAMYSSQKISSHPLGTPLSLFPVFADTNNVEWSKFT